MHETALLPGQDVVSPHQPLDALLADANPASPQLTVNARAAVGPMAAHHRCPDLHDQLGRWRLPSPGRGGRPTRSNRSESAKLPALQKNELLLRRLVWSVTCLVHTMYELGIELSFWNARATELAS